MVESSSMLEVLRIIRRYVEKKTINIEKVNFDILLSNDEKVLNDIIEESDTKKRVTLIYLYSNEAFMSDKNKHKESLIEYFKTLELKDFQLKKGIEVATNADVLAREDSKEIISLIVNAKEDYQAYRGSYVAENARVLAREDAKEIISLIVNAKGACQAYCGSDVARNADVLAREDYREILDLIVNAKENYQAEYGSKVAINADVLAREDYREILYLIVNTEGIKQIQHGTFLATDKKLLASDDYREQLYLALASLTNLYQSKFCSNAYLKFMDELEKSSDEKINQFIKKFKK